MIANKKGQEMTIGTLLLIVLGVVVVVVLIIGFTLGTDFFFDLIQRGPSDIQLTAGACEVFAQGGLKLDFCTEFKEISILGRDQWVNCQFPQIDSVLDTKIACGNSTVESTTFCDRLKISDPLNFDNSTLVNGVRCADLGVA